MLQHVTYEPKEAGGVMRAAGQSGVLKEKAYMFVVDFERVAVEPKYSDASDATNHGSWMSNFTPESMVDRD
jgi:hypothetical protein